MLVTHPKVMDAAVFASPTTRWASRSRVWCRRSTRPMRPTPAEELLAWLREHLTHYKCPRSISFEAQLPRTDTGKL